MKFIYLVQVFATYLCMTCALNASSQTYYSEHTTARVYTDVKLALKEKYRVFKLDLRHQNLTEIPKEVYELPYLEYLVLDDNKITTISFDSKSLRELKYLSLKQNQIQEFVVKHGCLNQLKELYLDQNRLIEFPEINNSFIELTTLSVRINYITHLPTEALNLVQARILQFDSNPLTNAQQAFYYSAKLERLSLYETGLKNLDSEIYLPQLRKLVIGNNKFDLKSLNNKQFPKLEFLDISYIIPESTIDLNSVTQLAKLKYLIMEGMDLNELPESIGNMKKLRDLSLLRNSLVELPEVFYDLDLKLLNLEENPLSESCKKKIKSSLTKCVLHF